MGKITSAIRRAQRPLLLFIVLTTALTRSAEAHVKWFCGSVDVTMAPLGLWAVLSPTLLLVGFASMTLISAGGLADAIALRRWPVLLWHSPQLEVIEELLVRYGAAAYLVLLWADIGVAPWRGAHDGAILTPELLAHDTWLGWLQLVTGLLLLSRYTCALAALGLAAMYAVGIARYGIFHMTDYAFFLGLAGYVALSSPLFDRHTDIRRWRVPLIAATVGFSLMWTAIEKFLYPGWAGIILATHPNVTFGFPIPFVTIAAGFVEFSVAFYLLIGRSLLRIDAAIVVLVLLAAIPEFGALDTVGHLPLVVMLLALVLHGPTALQAAASPRPTGITMAALRTAALYILSFAVLMAMYYGLQKAGTLF